MVQEQSLLEVLGGLALRWHARSERRIVAGGHRRGVQRVPDGRVELQRSLRLTASPTAHASATPRGERAVALEDEALVGVRPRAAREHLKLGARWRVRLEAWGPRCTFRAVTKGYDSTSGVSLSRHVDFRADIATLRSAISNQASTAPTFEPSFWVNLSCERGNTHGF